MKQGFLISVALIFYSICCLVDQTLSLSSCPIECLDANNCNLPQCADCEFNCVPTKSRTCPNNLSLSSCSSKCRSTPYFCNLSDCAKCFFCPVNSKTTCPLAYFVDITDDKFSSFPEYFNQWKHSGKPYPHEGAPLFVDINNDGLLDYFNSMHAHQLDSQGYNRMEMALTSATSLTTPSRDVSKGSLLVISNRIINTETSMTNMDPHGEVMVDLDNDGYLDLFVVSGGGEGGDFANEWTAATRDNFLFWGEPSDATKYKIYGDNTTSDEFSYNDIDGGSVTIFLGGRNMARKAGIEGRYGRSRISYLLDVNNDGLLDIFVMQDRRVTNVLAPGILLINQGNRTWREEPSMTEFSRAMILTDADGDGLANEFMINRGFCFPQRSGPGIDPKNPDMGPYSSEVLTFCSNRPVGTTAVYRFNNTTKKMDLISPSYNNVSADPTKQPSCCPNGAYAGSNDCHARSIATGDFDGDLKTDHIFLYSSKMVFYFSSERPTGSLAGGSQNIGLEITLPPNCIEGESIRVVDIDNDGKEEIVIMCKYAGGILMYSRTSSYTSWTLMNGCNSANAMGALVNRFLFQFSKTEINQFCSQNPSGWELVSKLCNNNKLPVSQFQLDAAGLSLVDLDNDGFLDVVATADKGRLRIFKNTPPPQVRNNRFVAFRLKGNGYNTNLYGIGAVVVLYTSEGQQFREISSYQHTTDKFGSKEDRIIFGLGLTALPIKVVVRWPGGKETTSTFIQWTPSSILEPIVLDENTSTIPVTTRILHESRLRGSSWNPK